jgi:hypothetical protein
MDKAAVIELEKIGGNKPWVARIVGTDPKYGLAREFVDGAVDYSRANRPRTRGVYYTYYLKNGYYEVKGGHSWGHANDRKFVRVTSGKVEPATLQEVLESIQRS